MILHQVRDGMRIHTPTHLVHCPRATTHFATVRSSADGEFDPLPTGASALLLGPAPAAPPQVLPRGPRAPRAIVAGYVVDARRGAGSGVKLWNVRSALSSRQQPSVARDEGRGDAASVPSVANTLVHVPAVDRFVIIDIHQVPAAAPFFHLATGRSGTGLLRAPSCWNRRGPSPHVMRCLRQRWPRRPSSIRWHPLRPARRGACLGRQVWGRGRRQAQRLACFPPRELQSTSGSARAGQGSPT